MRTKCTGIRIREIQVCVLVRIKVVDDGGPQQRGWDNRKIPAAGRGWNEVRLAGWRTVGLVINLVQGCAIGSYRPVIIKIIPEIWIISTNANVRAVNVVILEQAH